MLLSAWTPVAIGMCVIALESTEMFGAQNTTGPLRALYEAIFGPVTSQRWDVLHHIIRKLGHFLGYGAIGLCWLRAWRMTVPRFSLWTDVLLAFVGTAFIASSDELHQAFLPDRTGMFSDVLLDCCGAVVMFSILLLVHGLFQKRSHAD
jgi:VanZ family protein